MSRKIQAEIIAIGNEILDGRIVNSNAAYLSQQLIKQGISVIQHTAVADDETQMLQAFASAAVRAQLILVTGGLGPTADDFTLEVFAKFKKVSLQRDAVCEQHIKSYFTKLGRVPSQNQLDQALIPEGATVLTNIVGTAPGVYAEFNGVHFFFFPGVPQEMQTMFKAQALPLIIKIFPEREAYAEIILRCFGTPEGTLDHLIREELQNRVELQGVSLAFQVKLPDILIKLSTSEKSLNLAEQKVNKAVEKLTEKIGNYIYATGETDLAMVVGDLLKQQTKTLAVAESCTGGYLANWITNVPGASLYFLEGAVTYANEAKITRLNVDPEVLATEGAVSEAVARQMAEGIRKNLQTDFGFGITGIAGPGGGTADKPQGTVYVALASEKTTWCKRFQLPFPRETFKKMVAAVALDRLRRTLIEFK